MGVYVFDHHHYKHHRVFKQLGAGGLEGPKYLYYGGEELHDQGWKIGPRVGSTEYFMEIGRSRFANVDMVRDDMLGEWKVDFYEINYQVQRAKPGHKGATGAKRPKPKLEENNVGSSSGDIDPIDAQMTTFTVSVKCVCQTVGITGLARGQPGHEAMGAFTVRQELGETAMGQRRVYRLVAEGGGGGQGAPEQAESKQPAAATLPPMALFYNSPANAWQVSRFAENFHVRALSIAGAPEAIFHAAMGDSVANFGWDVQLDAGKNDRALLATAQPPRVTAGADGEAAPRLRAAAAAAAAAAAKQTVAEDAAIKLMLNDAKDHAPSRAVRVACACPGVRLGGLPAAHKGNRYLGTFIFTGSHFDGRRVYAAPFRAAYGGAFDSLAFPHHDIKEIYLHYQAARRGESPWGPGWVIGPTVGDALAPLTFARALSTAGLPELMDRTVRWEIGSWQERPGDFELVESGTYEDAAVKVECVMHPKIPPTPAPLHKVAVPSKAPGLAAAPDAKRGKAAGSSEWAEEAIAKVTAPGAQPTDPWDGVSGIPWAGGRYVSHWVLVAIVVLVLAIVYLCTTKPKPHPRRQRGGSGGRGGRGAEIEPDAFANEEGFDATTSLVRRKSADRRLSGGSSPQRVHADPDARKPSWASRRAQPQHRNSA